MTKEQELIKTIKELVEKLNEQTKKVIAYKDEREELLESNWNMARKLAKADAEIKSLKADLEYTQIQLIHIKAIKKVQ